MQRRGLSKARGDGANALRLRALVRPLLKWFKGNARDLPWRRTHDPYAIWISEIMLQQTQVKAVIPYWERWMRRLPDARALARARADTVLKLWEGLGYYLRARNLQKSARIIVDQHGGQFPEQFDDILALPGIGRYTAGAIGSIAFNQPTPVLDGNVTRVLTRVFGIAGNPRQTKTSARLWELAEDLVQTADQTGRSGERSCSHLNQALMELGAVVCTPLRPKCPGCPVRNCCLAYGQPGKANEPTFARRVPSTPLRFVAFVVERNKRFLVRRRPAAVVNGRLWEFPNFEVTGPRADQRRLAESLLGSRPAAIRLLHQVRHTITRYRITTDAYKVQFASRMFRTPAHGRWCSLSQLRKLAFPSAHRKILEALRTRVHSRDSGGLQTPRLRSLPGITELIARRNQPSSPTSYGKERPSNRRLYRQVR